MNRLQRVVWLAKRNFLRGSLWNVATVILMSVISLAFFAFFLFRSQPAPEFLRQYAQMLWLPEKLLIVILALSFIALFVIFTLINRVRYHEIGVLRGIGARRSFIFLLVLFETQFLVWAGALMAVLLGFVFSKLAGESLGELFRLADGIHGVLHVLLAALLSICCSTLVAALAALYPAIYISSIEPYNAIRNRE